MRLLRALCWFISTFAIVRGQSTLMDQGSEGLQLLDLSATGGGSEHTHSNIVKELTSASGAQQSGEASHGAKGSVAAVKKKADPAHTAADSGTGSQVSDPGPVSANVQESVSSQGQLGDSQGQMGGSQTVAGSMGERFDPGMMDPRMGRDPGLAPHGMGLDPRGGLDMRGGPVPGMPTDAAMFDPRFGMVSDLDLRGRRMPSPVPYDPFLPGRRPVGLGMGTGMRMGGRMDRVRGMDMPGGRFGMPDRFGRSRFDSIGMRQDMRMAGGASMDGMPSSPSGPGGFRVPGATLGDSSMAGTAGGSLSDPRSFPPGSDPRATVGFDSMARRDSLSESRLIGTGGSEIRMPGNRFGAPDGFPGDVGGVMTAGGAFRDGVSGAVQFDGSMASGSVDTGASSSPGGSGSGSSIGAGAGADTGSGVDTAGGVAASGRQDSLMGRGDSLMGREDSLMGRGDSLMGREGSMMGAGGTLGVFTEPRFDSRMMGGRMSMSGGSLYPTPYRVRGSSFYPDYRFPRFSSYRYPGTPIYPYYRRIRSRFSSPYTIPYFSYSPYSTFVV